MSLKISRILHAGYIFECGETKIAFDPIFENPFSKNCYAFPNVEFDHVQIKNLKLDAVFISHYHDDHCSLESLNDLRRDTPIFLYCIFEELFSLIRKLGFTHVYPLKIDQSVKIGDFRIIPRRALDEDVDSIFHIEANGLNVLNVVDSWIDEPTLELLRDTQWDMILWPFQTMREIEVLSPSKASPPNEHLPREWISQLRILKPRWIIPSSCQFIHETWSWYNQAFFPISYAQFRNEIEAKVPGSRVVRLDPSVSVLLSEKSLEESPHLSWLKQTADQIVDYEFTSDLKAPPTSEIAQHFDMLTPNEANIVYDYCRHGLLEKYRSMETSLEKYFDKPRTWRLSVYDHLGEAEHFFFQLKQSDIQPTSCESLPEWTTEIPLAKFYAALALGESLTSLYMRINDFVFDFKIEHEIRSADIVEDPLIRCLFTGVFAAYQMAQFKRLTLQ